MSHKKHAPATQRNKTPILNVLKDILPDNGQFLEIASGTGEHCVYFAGHFPSLTFHPSDIDPAALESIDAHARETDLDNIRPAIALDASTPELWPVKDIDIIICINMIHIAQWEATTGLFKGAGAVLNDDGKLITYGPYFDSAVETAPTNASFHRSLKARDKRWGLRDLKDIQSIAEEHNFSFEHKIAMPANNDILVFEKKSGT